MNSLQFPKYIRGLPRWLSSKESACQCGRLRFSPWVGKIPWRRKWQPTPVFLSGKSHGQRSLVGYSPWGCKRVGHNLATKLGLQRSYVTSKSICRILVFLVKCQTGKHQPPKDVFFCLFADDCVVGN